MMHVRKRAFTGASLITSAAAFAAARAIPANVEVKDGDAALTAEIKKGFDDFSRAFEEYQRKADTRFDKLEGREQDVVTKAELKSLDDLLNTLKKETNDAIAEMKRTHRADLERKDGLTDEQREYSKKFEQYFRTGEGDENDRVAHKAMKELERKAMSTLSDTDGGFVARPELENMIDATVKLVSPIRDLATVRRIGAKNYKKLVNVHGTTSGWVGETDARPQTLGPQLKELDFPAFELYAMPAATQDLLDDSFISIDQWLADEVALEFAAQEGSAFVNGSGVKKPQGFLAVPAVDNTNYVWGTTGYIVTGTSGDYTTNGTPPAGADCLVDLYHSLRPLYRKNATWSMNANTLSKTRKLKDGQGNFLIMRAFADDGIVERIMGRPVVETPDMPDPAANSFSVALADFKRWYLIVDRIGTRVLRDPFTTKPYVLFYTTKRVGGGVQNFEAGKLLKFGTS